MSLVKIVLCRYTNRAPVTATTEDTLAEDVEALIHVVMHGMPATEKRIEQIKKQQPKDDICI